MVALVASKNKISQQIKKLFQQNTEILNKYQSSYAKNIELTKPNKYIQVMKILNICMDLFNRLSETLFCIRTSYG